MIRANRWISSEGKYYYVGVNGAMITNTTISGHKISSDGT